LDSSAGREGATDPRTSIDLSSPDYSLLAIEITDARMSIQIHDIMLHIYIHVYKEQSSLTTDIHATSLAEVCQRTDSRHAVADTLPKSHVEN